MYHALSYNSTIENDEREVTSSTSSSASGDSNKRNLFSSMPIAPDGTPLPFEKDMGEISSSRQLSTYIFTILFFVPMLVV